MPHSKLSSYAKVPAYKNEETPEKISMKYIYCPDNKISDLRFQPPCRPARSCLTKKFAGD